MTADAQAALTGVSLFAFGVILGLAIGLVSR